MFHMQNCSLVQSHHMPSRKDPVHGSRALAKQPQSQAFHLRTLPMISKFTPTTVLGLPHFHLRYFPYQLLPLLLLSLYASSSLYERTSDTAIINRAEAAGDLLWVASLTFPLPCILSSLFPLMRNGPACNPWSQPRAPEAVLASWGQAQQEALRQ